MVRAATRSCAFRVEGGTRPVDGPALARRRREHRKAYQRRSRGVFDQEWLGAAMCVGILIVVVLVVVGAFSSRHWW